MFEAMQRQLEEQRQQHDKAVQDAEVRHGKEAEEATQRAAQVGAGRGWGSLGSCRREAGGWWSKGRRDVALPLLAATRACHAKRHGAATWAPKVNQGAPPLPLPCRPPQGLEKEKEEQRKLQRELAAQQTKVATAEAAAEKVGAGCRPGLWGSPCACSRAP